eukprot:TRINITY_DN19650_c0_g1_i2.p1 TRINITY_DN19650_c0_g1~~TRINITY_DN19650_c0_g1_i2.p1  ORF type:complete len:410 (-),score=19.38 TRINITY_DN19650_c0_g1_i2:94-1323(-)
MARFRLFAYILAVLCIVALVFDHTRLHYARKKEGRISPKNATQCLGGLHILDRSRSRRTDLFSIEAALLDRRACPPHSENYCSRTVMVWALRRDRSVSVLSCSSSQLGPGSWEEVSTRREFRRILQVACSWQVPAASLIGGREYLEITFNEGSGTAMVARTLVRSPSGNEECGQSTASTHIRVGTCVAMLHSDLPHLSTWVDHQFMLGVQGIHLYTFDRNILLSNESREFVLRHRAASKIELVEWPYMWSKHWRPQIHNKEDIPDLEPSQTTALSHCIVNNAARYDWIMVVDTDEFLLLGSPYTYGSLQELLDIEGRKDVDSILISRHAVRISQNGEFSTCKEKRQVAGKSFMRARTVVSVDAHWPLMSWNDTLGTRAGFRTPQSRSTVPSSGAIFGHLRTGSKGCQDS